MDRVLKVNGLMFRVMPIVGVRPQFIKAAPLLRLLDEDDEVELQLIHSGQHYDSLKKSVSSLGLGGVSLC